VARNTAAALNAMGIESCLFGSAACSMYGVSRVPNDVDMIALTSTWDTEQIKEGLLSMNTKFFLKPSRNRANTYQILYYRLYSRIFGDERSCKVDILIPGNKGIPRIPRGRIMYTYIPGVPVMPLLALLLLKLQGWVDHRDSPRRDYQAKQHVDVEDIIELLDIVLEAGVGLGTEKWMPRAFVRRAEWRVDEFVTEFPDTFDSWIELGF